MNSFGFLIYACVFNNNNELVVRTEYYFLPDLCHGDARWSQRGYQMQPGLLWQHVPLTPPSSCSATAITSIPVSHTTRSSQSSPQRSGAQVITGLRLNKLCKCVRCRETPARKEGNSKQLKGSAFEGEPWERQQHRSVVPNWAFSEPPASLFPKSCLRIAAGFP